MPSKRANSPCSEGHCGLTLASAALKTPTIRSILTIAPTLKAATATAPVLSVQAGMVLAQVKMSRVIAQGTTAHVCGSSLQGLELERLKSNGGELGTKVSTS